MRLPRLPRPTDDPRGWSRRLGSGLVFLLLLTSILVLFGTPVEEIPTIPLTEAAEKVSAGEIAKIAVQEDLLTLERAADGRKLRATREPDVSVTESLKNLGVSEEALRRVAIEVKRPSGIGFWTSVLLPAILPFALLALFMVFMIRSAAAANNRAIGFGQVRVKPTGELPPKKKVTFKDVAGAKEAKEELMEVVEFLQHPKKFTALGAKIPKGVLLVGPPGTGKTLLAKAVAGQANVPFFHMSGSEFIELFVGVGASTHPDTKVLVKASDRTELLPIGEFVDRFYPQGGGGFPVPVEDVWTLGVDFSRGNKFSGTSAWKKVGAVYRHRARTLYEIRFIGGSVTVTADHSVFVREGNHIQAKRTADLKIGESLVALPYKTRNVFVPGLGTTHRIKTHSFPRKPGGYSLTVWESSHEPPATRSPGFRHVPRSIAHAFQPVGSGRRVAVSRTALVAVPAQPSQSVRYSVPLTKELCKLLGYYTAEGDYHARSLRFSFGAHETDLHADCQHLLSDVFHQHTLVRYPHPTAIHLQVASVPIGEFFVQHCGKGAAKKHVPEFIWDAPREYFVSYLEGLVAGGGYINRKSLIEFTSCSPQLVSELRWLLHMHGMPCSVTTYQQRGGRRIRNNRSILPDSTYDRITIGKSANPFLPRTTDFGRKAKITEIIERTYDGYVYDLCGVENEAFFGGDKPVLLHNSRVRSLFQKAKKHAPSIVFVDELDAVGRMRGSGLGGGHDEREQTLNQILVEMDGFDTDDRIILLAATNRPDVLDPALLRPGRFDRHVTLDMPDINEREEILKVHVGDKPLGRDVNLRTLAERTPGFSGADLANLMNEAAIFAARRNKKQIGMPELLDSIEKVLLGPERKSHVFSPREKAIAAFHEAGHAIVAHVLPHVDPVRKISIVSRGRAGGFTLKLPEEDKHLHSRSEFLGELATLLGGYAAETVRYGEITTGAGNDLKRATQLARRIVTEYGMSALGPMTYGEKEELVFLGRDLMEHRNYSDETASKIDAEIARLLAKARERAEEVIREHRAKWEEIARILIEKETIEQDEFAALMAGTPRGGAAHEAPEPTPAAPTTPAPEETPPPRPRRAPRAEPKPAPAGV